MERPKSTPAEVRQFILDNVTEHPRDIVRVTVDRFGITRQRVNQHLRTLVKDGQIQSDGNTRAKTYQLTPLVTHVDEIAITPGLEEHVTWRDFVAPYVRDLPSNVIEICQYGFTEMVNNVLSHSNANTLRVAVARDPVRITLTVDDNGIGVFRRIQEAFGYDDSRQALLELSKGKVTSDPDRHTGEGIFFTSKMFDEFSIYSGSLFYTKLRTDSDWLIEVRDTSSYNGTLVMMKIRIASRQTMKEVFDQYASGDDFDFSKTHVPILLAKYDQEQLISRSQARRVLARFDRFKEVILDFQGVELVGQAFADEIFRVYRTENPQIEIIVANAVPTVQETINRVRRDERGT